MRALVTGMLWRTFLLTPFKLIKVFLHEASHAIACKLTCGEVEGIQVHANEGGVTQTRGSIYWLILPARYLGSSFWGMALILASTNLLTARIAAGCLILSLLIVLFIAKNWTLRRLCIGFIVFIGVIWLLQELTTVRILRYIILFIGVMNSLFSVYDIYDDLISRRVHSSDAEKFAELCPCPFAGVYTVCGVDGHVIAADYDDTILTYSVAVDHHISQLDWRETTGGSEIKADGAEPESSWT
ncbi:Unknown protein [Striga hermonthica]|uniref:Peptidase M50B-like-domain-containing protein n=1 Tax=Striga hermonthica TaxID=68872 RepID=A0A9N7RRI7_STRHE|nr:Unknown protein [Striga hermonthica]